MTTRWWSLWKLQAKFWIYRANISFREKVQTLESLNNESHTVWKERANRGMTARDAVNTYIKRFVR